MCVSVCVAKAHQDKKEPCVKNVSPFKWRGEGVGRKKGGKGERKGGRWCKGETTDQRSLSCRGVLVGVTHTHTSMHIHKGKHRKTVRFCAKTVPTLRWQDIPSVRCVKRKKKSLCSFSAVLGA